MNIIIDARALRGYPVGMPAEFFGGTELYLHYLAAGLARHHTVHVVTPDLPVMEHRRDKLFYWPPSAFPVAADVVVMFHSLEHVVPYHAEKLVWASNGLGAFLGPNDEWASRIDVVACFSKTHADLLVKRNSNIPREKCHVTGLGVDLDDYPKDHSSTVFGRMLYGNSPERGLLNTIKVFENVQRRVPEATLHLTYDWARVFEAHKWAAHSIGEELWECRRRIEANAAIVDRGPLNRHAVMEEQLACCVHAYPSAPPNVGSQIHGLMQMELAAAGVPLILSNTEAFPEVFGEAAEILPPPGAFMPENDRRCDEHDWAELVVELMKDKEAWAKASEKSRALSEKHTWDAVLLKWEEMLNGSMSGLDC